MAYNIEWKRENMYIGEVMRGIYVLYFEVDVPSINFNNSRFWAWDFYEVIVESA